MQPVTALEQKPIILAQIVLAKRRKHRWCRQFENAISIRVIILELSVLVVVIALRLLTVDREVQIVHNSPEQLEHVHERTLSLN